MALTLVTSDLIHGLDYSKLTGTIPTWNQNTTGSAATLTTARTIGGVSFNGSAAINLPGVNAAGNQNTSGTAAGLSATLVVGSGGTGVTSITALKNVLDDETWTFANNITATGTLTVNGTGNSAFNGDLYIVDKKLDISAPSGGNSYVRFSDTNSGAKIWRVGTSLSSRGVFNIYNQTDDSFPFNILANGSVGIGTTSTEGKLTINYTAANLPTSGTTSNSAIQILSSLNNQLNIGLNVAPSYGSYIQASDNNLAVPYSLNLQPNGGNVGIGTASARNPSSFGANSKFLTIESPVTGSETVSALELLGSGGGAATFRMASIGIGTRAGNNYFAQIDSLTEGTGGVGGSLRFSTTANASTTAPTTRLSISSTGALTITASANSTGNPRAIGFGGNSIGTNPLIYYDNAGNLVIDSKTSSKVYLNGDVNGDVILALGGGNVGIGTTSPFGVTSNRTALSVNGTTSSVVNIGTGGTQRGYFYAESNQVLLNTTGALPLSLGTNGSNYLTIASGGVLTKNGNSSSARIIPETDNAGYLGESSHRWQALYAVSGSIQTSDRNQKTLITTSDLGLDFILKLEPVSYKWKVGGYDIKENGKDEEPTKTPIDGKRNHYGLIAQQVKEVIGDKDFGGWVKEDLEDDASMESLRYAEFISPMIKAIQEQQAQIELLKQEVELLKQ